MWSESLIIEEIQKIFPPRADIASIGIGDDCAALKRPASLVTTDAAVEGVHFDLRWMTLADALYRCLSANLSDIAAMGAVPTAFTLAIGLKNTFPFSEIRNAILAMKDCLNDHNLRQCTLVGGDVVRSPQAVFSITMMAPAPPWKTVTRSGARPGDAILWIGNMGCAAAGLAICQTPGALENPTLAAYGNFLANFKRPTAQTAIAPLLAKTRLVHAMMDTSDGLMTDLPRMLAMSRCGADIRLDDIRPNDAMRQLAQNLNKDPMDWMICGGEDFALLVTSAPGDIEKIAEYARICHAPCKKIGTCTQKNGHIRWLKDGAEVFPKNTGFSHF